MKVEVNVTKKYFFGILAGILILAGVIGVLGYTKTLSAVPNPGHSLASIQGYFATDANLEDSLGKFCNSDGQNCAAPTGAGKVCVKVFSDNEVDSQEKSVNIVVGGTNICNANGCDILGYSIYDKSGGAGTVGEVTSVDSAVYVQESGSNYWAVEAVDDSGLVKGILGSGNTLIRNWHSDGNCRLWDDYTGNVNTNGFVLRDTSGTARCYVSVCAR